METEFWGVEVKSGESLKVLPGYGKVLHVSQASLGEYKNEKGKESVSLFVNLDGKKLVLGTLITNKLPQHQFDLLFERDFELSHDWKSGSVYFYGYKASNSSGEDESYEEESDESEEDIPLNFADNGKRESKTKQEIPESEAKQEKPESEAKQEKPEFQAEQEQPESKTKQDRPIDAERCDASNKESDAGRDSVKIVETHKDVNPQEDDESSYEDMMSEDDDDDVSRVETSKKRPLESAAKTPLSDKKAKVNPPKTDGNETAPLPGKEAGKTPASKPYPCKICNKTFGTEQGVEAHTKAKHGDGRQP